jgi:hypothetical protein
MRFSKTHTLIVVCLLLGAIAAAVYLGARHREAAGPSRPIPGRDAQVEQFCSTCHKLPPPDTLPRGLWKAKVEAMYAMVGQTKDSPPTTNPPLDAAIDYYTSRAPVELPPCLSTVGVGSGPLSLEGFPLKLSGKPPYPGTSNVAFAHLYDDRRFDLLVCDMRFGMVLAMQPYESIQRIRLLAKVPHPCHAEVVDLDRDGVRDLLIANLGTVTPSDVTEGSVVWLRGNQGGGFESVTLARDLGRVADVRAADFDGDGDLDIVVAGFGWRRVGEILYLENRTVDYAAPVFAPYVVDSRPGTIHVPIADLNGDGRPDFVALISQHHETVVAFINQGHGRFESQVIFAADHPGWGSSGIDLADLDGDGDLDVVLSNGDTLDDLVLKPYHGIEWLENEGKYPYTYHRITSLYGVHRARVADLDGDGDLDIAACVFLPFVKSDTPGVELADSIIWLEQTSRGVFERHSLESATCTHPTLDVADYDGDGDMDIAVGNMTMAKAGGKEETIEDWVILFKNLRN